MISNQIYLVSGWRRTGKDTLFEQFNGNSKIPWNWFVYAHPKTQAPLVIQSVEQVSFANALKKDVLLRLNLPPDTDTEAIKDTVARDGKTFRDFLIQIAAEEREKDIDHWCKRAFENRLLNHPVMVTDWRYFNECKYVKTLANVCTIRVFRSVVDVSTVESEIQLNNFEPDYLLVPKKDHRSELDKLVLVLPQFEKYKEMPYYRKSN